MNRVKLGFISLAVLWAFPVYAQSINAKMAKEMGRDDAQIRCFLAEHYTAIRTQKDLDNMIYDMTTDEKRALRLKLLESFGSDYLKAYEAEIKKTPKCADYLEKIRFN